MALTTEQQTSHLSRLQQEILAWDYYRMGGEDQSEFPYLVMVQRGKRNVNLGRFPTAEAAARFFAQSPEGQRG